MDLIDLAMLGIGAISLGIALVAIAWPADTDVIIDPFAHPYGDIAFPDSARPASRADQGSGGNGKSSQGAAAARPLFRE